MDTWRQVALRCVMISLLQKLPWHAYICWLKLVVYTSSSWVFPIVWWDSILCTLNDPWLTTHTARVEYLQTVSGINIGNINRLWHKLGLLSSSRMFLSVICYMSHFICHMIPVTCHLPPVPCHLSPVTKPTATATDPPPANSAQCAGMNTEIDERSDFGNSFPICFLSIIKGASKSWKTDQYIFLTPTREPKITHAVAASSVFNSVLYIWVQQTTLLFFSRVASFKTRLRQCIGVEWLEVEIVSFVLFIGCI